jgi:hypothetical protein
MRSLFVLALSCFLAACAQQSHVQLYPGSAQPQEQVLTVVVPYELEVQSINGENVPAANALFGTQDKTLHLQPGQYRINAFYKNVFDVDGGLSSEVVRGRSAVFHIDGKAGETWQLEFRRPANLDEARMLKDEFPSWAVNTATGERIEAERGQRNSSVLSSLMGAGAADEASTVAPLAANSTPAAAPQPTFAASSVAAETLPHNDATLTTLKQLWHLMSPESRAAFLEWAQ